MFSVSLVLLTLLVQEDYVFLGIKNIPAKFFINDEKVIKISSGYINMYGLFVEERSTIILDKTKPLFDGENALKLGKHKSMPIDRRAKLLTDGCINQPAIRNEQVYEYRSGRLIPGYLQQNCDFLPEPGEAIIEFKDYVYSKTSKRIYNLPGKFVKRSEYETEKAKIEEAEKRKP